MEASTDPAAEVQWSIRQDTDAPSGNVLAALARLLLQVAERERQQLTRDAQSEEGAAED
jgi:hypothetical protein